MYIHMENYVADSPCFTLQDMLVSEKMDPSETLICSDLPALLSQHGALNDWTDNSSNIDDDMDTIQGSFICIEETLEDNALTLDFESKRNEVQIPSLDEDFEFDELMIDDVLLDHLDATETSESGSSFESILEESKNRLQESMRRSQQTRQSICLKATDLQVLCEPRRLQNAIRSVQESTLRLQSYLD